MRSIKDKIKNSFSRSAATYDLASDIQNLISDKMLPLIKDRQFRDILEIGTGTGNYTQKLIELNKTAEFLLLDFSEAMIKMAKKKLKQYNNKIEYCIKDIEDLTSESFADKKFDLITSNATFQWLFDLNQSVGLFYDLLTPGGVLLFSCYGNYTYQELNMALQLHFPLQDNHLPAAAFVSEHLLSAVLSAHFHNLQIKEYTFKREYQDLLSLLKKIKKSGEYGYGLKKDMMLTRGDIRSIEKIYLKKYKKIVATYHYYVIFTSKL